MTEDFDLTDPLHRRAVQQVMSELQRTMSASEAAEPHALLVTDPQTGSRPGLLQVRASALLAGVSICPPRWHV